MMQTLFTWFLNEEANLTKPSLSVFPDSSERHSAYQMLSVIMLIVAVLFLMLSHYAECCYTGCIYADCNYEESRHADCRGAIRANLL
jgi:hypothetical protein